MRDIPQASNDSVNESSFAKDNGFLASCEQGLDAFPKSIDDSRISMSGGDGNRGAAWESSTDGVEVGQGKDGNPESLTFNNSKFFGNHISNPASSLAMYEMAKGGGDGMFGETPEAAQAKEMSTKIMEHMAGSNMSWAEAVERAKTA